MSGNDSQGPYDPRLFRKGNLNKDDIAAYLRTGADASVLYDAGNKVWDNQVITNRVYTSTGADITQTYNEFQDWLTKSKESDKAHAEYVRRKQDMPGRDATLVGFNQQVGNTVIGSPKSYAKTVLG